MLPLVKLSLNLYLKKLFDIDLKIWYNYCNGYAENNLTEVIDMDFDQTMRFVSKKDTDSEPREILEKVYRALEDKGYQPVNQIIGYFLSGDPTYITSHNNARNEIVKMERDELLEAILKEYLNIE